MTNPLSNKVVLITGASSGIGKSTALAMAKVGARVGLVARRSEQLNRIVDDIRAENGEAEFFTADLAREDQALAAAAWAEETFGQVDILVNNAGILRPGAIASGDSRDWRDTFEVNVLAPMYLSKAVLAGMQQRESGHIVMISSNAAKMPGSPGNSAYAASKYSVTALSHALRKEVASFGIRVTVIEPGATKTDIADTISDAATRAQMDAHLAREGVMQAEDIAGAILYAVSQPQRVNIDEIWLTPTR